MIATQMTREEAVERLRKSARKCGIEGDAIGILGRAFKSVAVKQENSGYEIDGVATTDDVDCDREVVLPDGLRWDAVAKYKALYVDHMYGTKHAVAVYRYTSRTTSPNGWRLRARMLPDEYSDEVARVRMLAEHGALGLSIGFLATDRGAPTADEKRRYPAAESIVRKAEVFEVSYTSMPCNMACTGSVVYADDSKSAKVGELVRKGIISPESWVPKPRRIVVVA